ncbi:hypothetical protein Q8A67_016990 [Cirrhinus molitorella]|uniref:Uncharacterized protein n=1 Tax=Cirrhinus molitorella TaxID=172907 RepID=A0AA88PMP7_9TELE|nr:hypothetical protein Q8A67_016990 [Cirrhinus molitorella]
MRAYCVLLHIFAAFLLCDYGVFLTPGTSPSEMPATATSDMSNSSSIGTTAEPTTVGNDSRLLESGIETDQSNNSFPSYPQTTQSIKNAPINESILDGTHTNVSSKDNLGKEDESGSKKIFSTAQPKQSFTDGAKAADNKGSETAGIILLVFILMLIVCLLVILYFLRRKARSYSFDLTRLDITPNDYVDTPLRNDQQGISYEQTTKDLPVCLDYINEDKAEEKTNSMANGSVGEQAEQTPTSETDYGNFPEENSFSSVSSLASPTKKVEFNLDLDLLGSDSELNCTTEAEATDAEQNENNNNAGQETPAQIFTEISLDEPKEHA